MRKAVKRVRKAVKHVRKAVKYMRKAVKHVRKAVKPHENNSQTLFGKHFCSFEDSLLGYSISPFQKGKPWKPMPIPMFLKANV